MSATSSTRLRPPPPPDRPAGRSTVAAPLGGARSGASGGGDARGKHRVPQAAGRWARAALFAPVGIFVMTRDHALPYAQVHRDACEATVRGGLDEARYRGAWDQGNGLAREQVAPAALEQPPAT